jgi:two-component system, chemotaxis family, response regulator Rcp1
MAGRRGLITISHSGATSASRTLSASRILRFTRFRSTAFPNALGTVNPSRGPQSDGRCTRKQNAAKHRPVIRFPSLYALRKSAVRRIRELFGKPKLVGVPDGSLVANGEFVAALGPAPGKYGAAIFRGHTYAESMCLCPFTVVWLKGAFWHFEFLGPGKHPKRRRLLSFSISGAKSGVKPSMPPQLRGASVSDDFNILLIDDSPADAKVFEAAVQQAAPRAKLYWVSSGKEGLQYLRQEGRFQGLGPVDIVVCDLNMPGTTGFDFAAQMKKDPELMIIPLIIYSGSRAPQDVHRAYALGVNSYLVKPMTLDAIIQQVHRWSDSGSTR